MVITGAPRKRLAPKGARGFESHPHRIDNFLSEVTRLVADEPRPECLMKIVNKNNDVFGRCLICYIFNNKF